MSTSSLRRSTRLVLGSVLLLALGAASAGAAIVTSGSWVAQGPRPITNGQVEGPTVASGAVLGAVQTVACHPIDADIMYVGAVHGGIWRTNDGTAASPTWTPQLDTSTDLAIGDIEFDPLDPTGNTLVAGVCYMSSYFTNTTALGGVWRTTNGGTTWTLMGDATIQGENVIAVQAHGMTIVAGSNGRAHFLDGVFGAAALGTGQLMRSTDGGSTWTVISGGAGTGLPAGAIFDVKDDRSGATPASINNLYCTVARKGVYHSPDFGATWNNISAGDATLNGIITSASNNNAELAVGSDGRLYVAVMLNGRLNYIGYTTNPAAAAPIWTRMDTPLVTMLDGSVKGIQPREKPGGQGSTHFSITADPVTPTLVYVGGDRQDANGGPPAASEWPNVLGASDYSGNLWRGDATQPFTGAPFSPQWDHLTHSNAVGAIPGGGTASGSAPHADSRDLAFDALGNLIETDDAGIYRRTSPTSNAGDWFAIHGNLQLTEGHDVAYDTVSNIIMTGNQDTGTTFQTAPGSTTWTSLALVPPFTYTPWAGAAMSSITWSTGDGGDVQVDPVNPAGGSTRYSSFPNLGLWRAQTYNAGGTVTGQTFPALAGPGIAAQFKTPVALNAVNPLRLVVGGANGVFESLDQGATEAAVPGGGGVNVPDALAYGGMSGGVPNPDVLYIGTGSQVRIRTTSGGNLVASAAYPGGYVRDIVLDPDDWMDAYVVDQDQVFHTPDAGATWTDVTGNLAALGAVEFLSLEYIPDPNADGIVVGTRTGVYVTTEAALGTWAALGNGLPNAFAWDMDYDPADDVLVVSTMGRGVWTLTDVSVPDMTPPVITSNVVRTLLWPARGGMMPIGFSASAVDAVDPNPTVTVDVYSDEPDGAPPFAPDATGTLPGNTALRAERAYPGDGRVYLVVVKATDASGNTAVACHTVLVPVMPVGTWIVGAQAQGAAAQAYCAANGGAAPIGYTLLLNYTLP